MPKASPEESTFDQLEDEEMKAFHHFCDRIEPVPQ